MRPHTSSDKKTHKKGKVAFSCRITFRGHGTTETSNEKKFISTCRNFIGSTTPMNHLNVTVRQKHLNTELQGE